SEKLMAYRVTVTEHIEFIGATDVGEARVSTTQHRRLLAGRYAHGVIGCSRGATQHDELIGVANHMHRAPISEICECVYVLDRIVIEAGGVISGNDAVVHQDGYDEKRVQQDAAATGHAPD